MNKYSNSDLVSIAIHNKAEGNRTIGIIKFLYGQKPDKEAFINMVSLILSSSPDCSGCIDCIKSLVDDAWVALQEL